MSADRVFIAVHFLLAESITSANMSLPEKTCANNVDHRWKRASSPLEGPSLKRQKTQAASWTDKDISREARVIYRPAAKMVPSVATVQSNIIIHFSCNFFHGQEIDFHGPYTAWLYTLRALPSIANTLNTKQ